MRRLLALLACLATPAFATVDAWPALHDVVGVDEGDVLNIRSGPGSGYEIVGTLPHDAEGIEVIRPSDTYTWGLVRSGEGMGWASLTYLVPQGGQWDGKFPEFATCAGTEPFWSLARADGALTLDLIDADPVTARIDFETGTLNHRGRHSFRAGDMVGVLSNQMCTDGMSDLEYGWELNLILLEQILHLQGCCTLQPPAR